MSLLNFSGEKVADWIQQVQAFEAEAYNAKNDAAVQLLALRQNPMRNRVQTHKRSYTAADGSRVVIQNTDTIRYYKSLGAPPFKSLGAPPTHFQSLVGPSVPKARAVGPKTVGPPRTVGQAQTTKRKSTQPRRIVKAVVPPKKAKVVGAAKRKITQPYRYIEDLEEVEELEESESESETETESESSESEEEDEEAEEIVED